VKVKREEKRGDRDPIWRDTPVVCSYYLKDEDVNFNDGASVRDKVTLL
jgi:hypothetical protein